MQAVTVQDVTVAYGENIAVRGVSFSLGRGEIAGLLGVSGSGKSTLARTLLGKLPGGARLVAGTVERMGTAALIPQEPALSLSPYLRAGEQVRRCAGRRHGGEARILELFAELGLPDPPRILRAYPHQLSGGQQQRVAWAQALIQSPDLLLADEPTTALDTIRQRELVTLVTAAARSRGCAVLWISHDLNLLAAVAPRLLVLESGRLVEDGPAGEILTRPSSPHVRALIEATR